MQTSDFDYYLPPELIAQEPVEPRDSSKLMLVERREKAISHHKFYDLINILKKGDVLVFNDSRVIPARIHGARSGTGGRVEVLLLKRESKNIWEAMVKPAKRLKPGSKIDIGNHRLTGEIIQDRNDGIKLICFSGEAALDDVGEIPLPPYIHRPLTDSERYQTIYSSARGSVAAPTSGLHFTKRLLEQIRQMGVETLFVTMHIGLDTFRPVQTEDPREHLIHTEYGVARKEVTRRLKIAKAEGRRIIAVGTSTARLLEHAAGAEGFNGWVGLYILPGYKFKVLDGLITNFHLPRSTLLMLVSAFAGRDFILAAYQEAINQHYRFYSFGDANIII